MLLLRIVLGTVTVSFILLLLSGTCTALMPPKDIAERNLEAKLILIGEVTEIGKILLPEEKPKKNRPKGLFLLKVRHVVKGFGTVNPGDEVRISFELPIKNENGGDVPDLVGTLRVEVKSGDLVVVYIDPSNFPTFYRPVAAGSSVVVIDRSTVGKAPGEKKSED